MQLLRSPHFRFADAIRHSSFVICHFFVLCLIVMSFSGCQTPKQRADDEKKNDEKWKHQDDGKDTSLQAFLGRLRRAAANKDVRTMAGMMTNDFAYSWAPGGEGYGCFKYWDENNIWPELQAIVRTDFMPNGAFLSAPPEFVQMGEAYRGFRAGIRREKGSFKFAYFVPAEDTPMAKPPADGN